MVLQRKGGRQVHGGGGLSDSALLIRYGDYDRGQSELRQVRSGIFPGRAAAGNGFSRESYIL